MEIIGESIKRVIKFRHHFNFVNAGADRHQRETLRRLLLKAADTAFGEHYKFHKILTYTDLIKAYQEAIPAHDYNKIYEEWWHRTLNNEADVCWRGQVRYFALSSGTSGAPSKYLPITPDMTQAMQRAASKVFFSLGNFNIPSDLFTKKMMMVGGCANLTEMSDGVFCGDLSGINANLVPMLFRPYYVPGYDIACLKDWNERLDAIAKNAHKWDVGYVTGLPPWIQLMMEKIIDYHKLDTIHDIWPNLSVFASGGLALEPYKKGFENITAKPLIYMDSYLASEGFIAFQERPETNAMMMVLNNGIFYEFVPFNEHNFDSEGNLRDDFTALTISEVQLNVNYALLMSTCAGAWRYLIGDTIRFTDLSRHEIVITGRTKHFLSITGEHLTVDNMNEGIQKTGRDMGVFIREFTVSAEKIDNYFIHRWYIGIDENVDANKLQTVLDAHLSAVNDDYRCERGEGKLNKIFVHLVPSNVFYEFQKSTNKLDGQSKFPRVMKGERWEQWKQFCASFVK